MDNIKYTNIPFKGFPEGKDRKKGAENLFKEIIDENFPNLGKEKTIQSMELRKHITIQTQKNFSKIPHIKTLKSLSFHFGTVG